MRLAILADTHSAPHPKTRPLLRGFKPDAILHAGDIGDLSVLDDLAEECPVLAVRGNIDGRMPGLADSLVIEILDQERLVLRLLMVHIGVYGPKLQANVARFAREIEATVVVCGHSHVPFLGKDRNILVYNPGSVGPRRFGLPIVFGLLDVSIAGLKMCHVDCETGETWMPPGVA